MILKFARGSRERLSDNFTSIEFDCRCSLADCKETYVDTALVKLLQKTRELITAPLIINSAFRCKEHNANVGGAPLSFHVLGMAADVRSTRMRPETLLKNLDSILSPSEGGLFLYPTHVHADVRRDRAGFARA